MLLAAVDFNDSETTGRLLLVGGLCLFGMTQITPRVGAATFEADHGEGSSGPFGGQIDAVVVARAAVVVAAIVGGLFVGTMGAVVLAATVVVAYRLTGEARISKRRAAFEEQLPELMQMLAGSLRSGTSFLQALETVKDEAPHPMSSEIRRVLHEARLGRDLGDSFTDLAERMQSKDFEWIVGAFDIHREVGGDLAEILDRIADTIRGRNRVRGQVKALSAEGRFSGLVLTLLAPGIFVTLAVLNPEYVQELTATNMGWALLGTAGALLAIGAFWLQRMARFEF